MLGGIRKYARIRPAGPRAAARLLIAYAVGFVFVTTLPSRYATIGLFIPGRSPLPIYFGHRIAATVRPRTEDISILAGVNEPMANEWFRVAKNEVVVDVGAHVGRYTLTAAEAGAAVIAIEPDPSNYAALCSNISRNNFRNVESHLVALSDRAGTGVLSQEPQTSTRSLESAWQLSVPSRSRAPGEVVRVETADSLLTGLAGRSIDWLKVDVEGHEIQVLRGARETLARTRNVILEVTTAHSDECLRMMTQAGFSLIAVESADRTENWLLGRARS